MKDLDAHYNAQDDIINLGKIFAMESDVDKIIEEKEMGPRELIRGTYNLRHVSDFTARTLKLTLYSRYRIDRKGRNFQRRSRSER